MQTMFYIFCLLNMPGIAFVYACVCLWACFCQPVFGSLSFAESLLMFSSATYSGPVKQTQANYILIIIVGCSIVYVVISCALSLKSQA